MVVITDVELMEVKQGRVTFVTNKGLYDYTPSPGPSIEIGGYEEMVEVKGREYIVGHNSVIVALGPEVCNTLEIPLNYIDQMEEKLKTLETEYDLLKRSFELEVEGGYQFNMDLEIKLNNANDEILKLKNDNKRLVGKLSKISKIESLPEILF